MQEIKDKQENSALSTVIKAYGVSEQDESMTECQQCRKLVQDLSPVPQGHGKSLGVCNVCARGESKAEAIHLNTPDSHCVRCPMCESTQCKDASEVDMSLGKGELFRCKCGCVFDMRKFTRGYPT